MGSILVNRSAAAVLLFPHTQLVFVSLLDEDEEEADEEEEDEHPVLFIHSVWRLNLPSSYGSVAVVVVVVADLSFSVDVDVSLLDPRLDPRDNSFVRVALNPQTAIPTRNITDTAPINEPRRVCLSSDVVKNRDDVGLDTSVCCCCCSCCEVVIISGKLLLKNIINS